MRSRSRLARLAAIGAAGLAASAAACHDAPPAADPDAAPVVDGTPAIDALDKSAGCATMFGSDLAPAFGRLDGTILAVVPPDDQACALPNKTHLVIQATISGVAYRLVVDVLSNQPPPDVYLHEIDAPLVGSAWAEGWHTDIPFDYVTDLAQHSDTFVAMPQADLVAAITAELQLGSHISVFATSGSTEPDSAHLVHRNATNQDGAIVVNPDSVAPHWILLRFDEQTF